MKVYSADLLALLASGVPMQTAELFSIGPCANGSYIYATTGQLPVAFNGNTYHPSLYGSWSRGEITTKVGLESNSCDLTVYADNQVPVYFPGTANAALLMDGIKMTLLGQAGVTIYKLHNSNYLPGYVFPATTGPTGGSLLETKFVGMVGPIPQIGATKTTITVQDMMYLLNIQVPHRVFQASCSHTLFDAGCNLSASAFTHTGSVHSVGPSPLTLVANQHFAPTGAVGTFTQGVLTWTSGANQGLSNFIKLWVPGTTQDTISLNVKAIFPIAVGDGFTVTQGCDQTFTSCLSLQGSSLNAYTNFGGQPCTPVPEMAIG